MTSTLESGALGYLQTVPFPSRNKPWIPSPGGRYQWLQVSRLIVKTSSLNYVDRQLKVELDGVFPVAVAYVALAPQAGGEEGTLHVQIGEAQKCYAASNPVILQLHNV